MSYSQISLGLSHTANIIMIIQKQAADIDGENKNYQEYFDSRTHHFHVLEIESGLRHPSLLLPCFCFMLFAEQKSEEFNKPQAQVSWRHRSSFTGPVNPHHQMLNELLLSFRESRLCLRRGLEWCSSRQIRNCHEHELFGRKLFVNHG